VYALCVHGDHRDVGLTSDQFGLEEVSLLSSYSGMSGGPPPSC